MKKILAYLLVLVSLMTLFCGTAGAADNSMDKNGYATTYVSMLVYDTDAKAAKYENVPVGCWTVVGRCYYATSDGRTYYPESASVQKATFSPYKGGISSTTTAQYQSSTSQIMENGKRTQVSLHYSCPILVKHYTNASKQNAKATYSEIHLLHEYYHDFAAVYHNNLFLPLQLRAPQTAQSFFFFNKLWRKYR